MASAGEGAARGLESGFRLAMDVHARQRQDERLDRQEARQGLMDQRTQEDRVRGQQRQEHADQSAALDRDEADFRRYGQIMADNPTDDPNVAAAFDARGAEIQRRKDERNARLDPGAAARTKQFAADREATVNGTATPDVALRHGEQVTGIPNQYFMRSQGPQGEVLPSEIDKAGQALMGDDPAAKIKAVNVLKRAELNQNVGKPGKHPDTTIMQTDVASLIPAPDSSEDDPALMADLIVWTKGGTPLNGPMPEGAPRGATNYYNAAMTEGRSADAKADPNVKRISLKAEMARINKLMEYGEAMNTPDGQKAYAAFKAEQDAQGGSDPFKRKDVTLQRWGIRKSKPIRDSSTLRPGDVRETTETDPNTGAITVVHRSEGNPKLGTTGAAQKDIDAIEAAVAADVYSRAEGDEKIRLRLQTAAQGGKVRGLGSGADGEGGGPDGLSKAQKRLRDADRDVLTGTFNRADKNADNAEAAAKDAQAKLDKLDAKVGNLMYDKKAEGAADKATRIKLQAEIAEKDELAKKARARASELSRELDKLVQESTEAAKPASTPTKTPAGKTAGKLTKDAAAAKFGF